MQPDDLHDALHLPISPKPRQTYSLTTTKSRAGDGLQGMTVETETVSLVPRHPCWPRNAPVPSCHKKDSVVFSSSKGKAREMDRRRSHSITAIDGSPPERRASEVPPSYWSTKNYGSSDDEGSDDSHLTTSTFSFPNFIDANCQPMGAQLAKTTSRMSRFSAYGLTAPESRRASAAVGEAPDGEGPAEWWLEKKRSLSSTSFVSPAGRRASMGLDLCYGTIGPSPTSHAQRRASSNLCKRCSSSRDAEAQSDSDNSISWSSWWSVIGFVSLNCLFPFAGGALLWWSVRHPDNNIPGILSIIPFTFWAILIAIFCKIYNDDPLPKCTCANSSGKRRMSPLLQQARKDLTDLERWRWERRRSSIPVWTRVPV